MFGILNYIKGLIDKSNSASTQAFLTIIICFTFLLLTVGTVIVSFCIKKPLITEIIALLSATCSLVGVQSITEITTSKKGDG